MHHQGAAGAMCAHSGTRHNTLMFGRYPHALNMTQRRYTQFSTAWQERDLLFTSHPVRCIHALSTNVAPGCNAQAYPKWSTVL
jgi:hypothetical protein